MYPIPAEVADAHRSLNLILVKLRWLIGEGIDRAELYDILDRIELLPTLLADTDSVLQFFMHVDDLAAKYPEFRLASDANNRSRLTEAV